MGSETFIEYGDALVLPRWTGWRTLMRFATDFVWSGARLEYGEDVAIAYVRRRSRVRGFGAVMIVRPDVVSVELREGGLS